MMVSGIGRAALLRFLTQTASISRANSQGYVVVKNSLRCKPYSPATTKSSFRAITTRHSDAPIGTIAFESGVDVQAKDRVTLSGRVFEVITPLTPDPDEWLRRALVREIQQPEREFYLALKPIDYDGANNSEALPELVRVLPIPFIADKQLETIAEREGSGAEIARLKQLEVAEIGIAYLTEQNRARLLYCLIIESGTTPTPEQARDRLFPRYVFNGSPSFENHHWSQMFPWSVALVEER
jgi:hypothetical protein